MATRCLCAESVYVPQAMAYTHNSRKLLSPSNAAAGSVVNAVPPRALTGLHSSEHLERDKIFSMDIARYFGFTRLRRLRRRHQLASAGINIPILHAATPSSTHAASNSPHMLPRQTHMCTTTKTINSQRKDDAETVEYPSWQHSHRVCL